MLKSHVKELLFVYECLFKDIKCTYPTLQVSLDRDLETLGVLANERGLHLFCVDLPDVGKHLDRCVSEGKYSIAGLPLTKRCPKRIMYPEFLSGLWGLVFDQDGNLKGDADVEALLFMRQIYYVAKKVRLDCSEDLVMDEVREFHAIDLALPEPEQFWQSEGTHQSLETYFGFSRSPIYKAHAYADPRFDIFLRKLDLVSNLLSSSLGPYRPSDWCFKHGPGVVSERKGFVNKYKFVNWSDRLEAVYPIADYGYHNYSSWGIGLLEDRDEIGSKDPSSRLISVQKTLTKPRLIAAEPSEHMWCQQNIWHYFRTRVQATWIAKFIRFTDQTRNQELCRRASLLGTLATLDLSSASDRVSCHFVGQLFRSNLGLLDALKATRTRFVTQDLAHDVPPVIELKKFSTMGNACTFPVESIGFLAIILAAVATVRGSKVCEETLSSFEEEVAVFGDDLVVPQDSRELCCQALEALGFKVNAGKSFWSGNFRESCGVDSYKGVDITPTYWRSLTSNEPESIVSAVEVRNSFYMRGFWSTAEHIASTVPRVAIPVVKTDSGVFGFKSFVGACLYGFKRRINKYLHRDEVLVQSISSRRELVEIKDDSVLLQYFTEKPEPWQPWAGGIGQRPKLRLALAWTDTGEVVS